MLSRKLSKKLQFSFLLALFAPSVSWAAACCGGGFAIPSLITGDEKANLTSSFSSGYVVADVFSNGVWQKRSESDASQIYKLEGAHIFNDRYQAGISIPVQTRNKSGAQGGNASGLADVAVQTGYEYLPDWDYSAWRPRGVGFLSLTLPTGKSIYEADTVGAIDSRGRGFWALGAGTILTKSWSAWDANTFFEVHQSFHKTIETSQVSGVLKPGMGGSFSVGTGYNQGNLRLGGSIQWVYEDAIRFESNTPSDGAVQRYAAGTLALSQMLEDNWAWTLSYTDQTIFGSPTNTTLSRSALFALQKRWDR